MQWFQGLFGRKTKLAPRIAHLDMVAQHQQIAPYNAISPTIYQQSAWVYVAVNRIAEAGALVPLRVLKLAGEKRQEVINHPLERLLSNPNPFMSRFELFEQTLGCLELHGNTYWYVVGDAQGKPAQIWVLRPDRVTIVPDEQAMVRGYLYEVDGKQIAFDAIEVVHFKRWHPSNDYYGLSALESARMAIQNDQAMAKWNHATFGQDQGVPAGIVNIKEPISEADFERIKREWRSSYGNGQRRTAFLRGGAVEWQTLGLSHHELDFLKGRQAYRDEILNIFGIPVGLVSENATEANAKVAERQFIERTLYPKLVRLAEKITRDLLTFYEGEHIAVFDDIRPTDTQARLEEIRTARGILSINEIRARFYDLPPVVWGDGNTEQSPIIESTKSISQELDQWERYIMKRIGQEDVRPFAVTAIPQEQAEALQTALGQISDKDSVKNLFTKIREQMLDINTL